MGKYSLKKKENILSEENAVGQVMMLLERYDIDLDSMEGKELKAMEQTVDNIVSGVMKGALEIFEENGEVKVRQNIQNLSEKATVKELVYRECKGSDHIAMKKEGNEQSKMLSLMSSMCETNGGFAVIEQLRSSDLKYLEYLSLLFL